MIKPTDASTNLPGIESGYIFDDEGCTLGGNGGLRYYLSRIKPGYIKDETAKVLLEMSEQIRAER